MLAFVLRITNALSAVAPLASVLKKRRFRKFGIRAGDRLPVADLQFRMACQNACCSAYIASSVAEVTKFACADTQKIVALFTPTSASTDLDRFPTMQDYVKTVSKETKGKYNRAANKARRLGYTSRITGRGAYARSVWKIRRSMRYRSRGPMFDAFRSPAVADTDSAIAFEPPICHEHWRIDWGLFLNDGDGDMKAFASLQRSGNFVSINEMIGHADVLALGGMKRLQFDIMEWLLGRKDPWLRGVRYLLHGAVEDGGPGLADWRRYVHQVPTLLRYVRPDEQWIPADFDPAVYLALHPDVRAARVDPRKHYVWHGMLEGRAYKNGSDSRQSD